MGFFFYNKKKIRFPFAKYKICKNYILKHIYWQYICILRYLGIFGSKSCNTFIASEKQQFGDRLT